MGAVGLGCQGRQKHCWSNSSAPGAHLSFLIPDPPIEVFPLQTQEVFPGVEDATLEGDGTSGVDVVAGDHADGDACTLAFLDGIRDLACKGKK